MSTTRMLDLLQPAAAAANVINSINDSEIPGSKSSASCAIEPAKKAEPVSLAEHAISVSYQIPYTELKTQRLIGSGTYAVVYAGSWRGMPIAMKQLKCPAKYLEEFKKEAAIMQTIQSLNLPDVVQYAGYSKNDRGSHLIVMELVPWKDGFDWAKANMDMCSAGQPARYALFRNIAIGIGHLHANDILHRDLKLENTLISDNLEIKLADFGWAIKVDCYASAYLGSERVGTANYMAPEIIKFNQYSFASDMFAFGSMLFALCEHYDALCYEGWTELKIMNYIGNHGMAKVPISDKTEPAIAALIRSCWQTDASKRPTASEAVAIIDAIAQHANVMNRKTSS